MKNIENLMCERWVALFEFPKIDFFWTGRKTNKVNIFVRLDTPSNDENELFCKIELSVEKYRGTKIGWDSTGLLNSNTSINSYTDLKANALIPPVIDSPEKAFDYYKIPKHIKNDIWEKAKYLCGKYTKIVEKTTPYSSYKDILYIPFQKGDGKDFEMVRNLLLDKRNYYLKDKNIAESLEKLKDFKNPF